MIDNINKVSDVCPDTNPLIITDSSNQNEALVEATDKRESSWPGFKEDTAEIDDDDKINENQKKEDNTIWTRLFGHMGPGSLRGCVFNLSILSLGVGCLSLPQKVGYFGWVYAPFFIWIAGISNWITLNLLSSLYSKYKIGNYSELVKHLYGKALSHFLNITIIVDIFGIIIWYQVVIYKLIGGWVNDIGDFGFLGIDDFWLHSFWKEKSYKFPVNYGIGICIWLPLCLWKDISKMRFASTFGIASLFVLIIIIVGQSPWFIINYFKNVYQKDTPSTHLNIADLTVGFTKDFTFFKGISTLLYAYSCHIGVFPVIQSLTNKSKTRINKVFKRAIILDVFCYILIGIIGYLSQPINTPDLIIERVKIFESDWLMTIGRFLFIWTWLAKICANYNALRIAFLSLFGYTNSVYPDWWNYVITIPVILWTTFVCIMYQSITDYISLIGSFCSVQISFLIPGLLYVKGNDEASMLRKILIMSLTLTISAIGLIGGVLTIITIVNQK